jgi:hypothetical protein
MWLRSGGVLVVGAAAIETLGIRLGTQGVAVNRCYARSEKYAVMMITSKSMALIARRKKPNDGSGITALPLFLAFAIGLEPQAGRSVPKQRAGRAKKPGKRSCSGV